jgi:hypothetical protein
VILQPVIAPLLVILVLPVLAATVWMLVRALRRAPAPSAFAPVL